MSTLYGFTDQFCYLCRNIPRAIGIGIPLVTIVYLLTNIAYFSVLSKQEIIDGGAVAVVSTIICQALFNIVFNLHVKFHITTTI